MSHLTREDLREQVKQRAQTRVSLGPMRLSTLVLHNLAYGIAFGAIIGVIGREVPLLATHGIILAFLLFAMGLRVKFPKGPQGGGKLATVLDIRVKRNHWTIAVMEIWEKPGAFALALVLSYLALVGPVIV